MNPDLKCALLITKLLRFVRSIYRKKETRIKQRQELLRMNRIKIWKQKNQKIGKKKLIIKRKVKIIKIRLLYQGNYCNVELMKKNTVNIGTF